MKGITRNYFPEVLNYLALLYIFYDAGFNWFHQK